MLKVRNVEDALVRREMVYWDESRRNIEPEYSGVRVMDVTPSGLCGQKMRNNSEVTIRVECYMAASGSSKDGRGVTMLTSGTVAVFLCAVGEQYEDRVGRLFSGMREKEWNPVLVDVGEGNGPVLLDKVRDSVGHGQAKCLTVEKKVLRSTHPEMFEGWTRWKVCIVWSTVGCQGFFLDVCGACAATYEAKVAISIDEWR